MATTTRCPLTTAPPQSSLPKRAPSPQHSSSSSSSMLSPSSQPPARCRLLLDLPSSLLFAICSFLSLYEIVRILRTTCQALHGRVTADCLVGRELLISGRSLPSFVQSNSRALASRIASLTIQFRWYKGDEAIESAMLPLHQLRHPLDASRFLFSSLTSLRVALGYFGRDSPLALLQSDLLSVVLLLAADADSFSSLRSLDIEHSQWNSAEFALPLSTLARLRSLTHCRFHMTKSSAFSCSSLLSALTSLPSLTSLDLGGSLEAWPQLLQLLCAPAATPLLLRLQSLVLPFLCEREAAIDGLHDAFLCRLKCLPAPSPLQRFSGVAVLSHRAAGLRAIFSLPHLTQLDLSGGVQRAVLSAFASSFACAPAPLVSLRLPEMQIEPGDLDRDEAEVAADEAAVATAVQQLLSRLTALRRLSCPGAMTCGAVVRPDGLQGDGVAGCSGSLYSLSLRPFRPSPFPFSTPLSFPLLTELVVNMAMEDAELELLLPACPQLLRLSCLSCQSWKAVSVAARCCPQLVELTVHVHTEEEQERDAAVAQPQPAVIPFLPQLISLRLFAGQLDPQPIDYDFSVLRLFTSPPHPQVRYLDVLGRGLSAHDVLSLACLPRLARLFLLLTNSDSERVYGYIPEVEEAHRRTQQQLLTMAAVRGEGHYVRARKDVWEEAEELPPLGPHQQQEMRQRVLDEAESCYSSNDVLACTPGVEPDVPRAVFFAELQTVLSDTVPAESGAGQTEGDDREAEAL